jgi:hypothetical protein
MPRSTQVVSYLRVFQPQYCTHFSSLLFMPCPSHPPSSFDNHHHTWWTVQIKQLFIIKYEVTNSVAPEPDSSLPYSQEPTTAPYPEPTESNLHHPAYLAMSHPDYIVTSMPRSSEWSLFHGLSHQNLAHFSVLSHMCHMPRPPHCPWFDLPNDICGQVQITELLIV